MGRLGIGIIVGVILALAAPAAAQSPVPAIQGSESDRQAIAASVHRQLTACWRLPPGFAGQRVQITAAFLGNGALDGEPAVTPLDGKASDKLALMVESAVQAVVRCAPFEGLEALGAAPDQRFSVVVVFQN